MQLKRSLILLALCLSGCVHNGPRVTACLVNAAKTGCDCYDERTGKSFTLTLAQCDKYVAFPPQDFETLINYCASPKR